MKNKFFIALFLAVAQAHAGDYPLKNRSAFAGSTATHNPFWPIGWAKPVAATSPVAAPTGGVVALKPENFLVTSILLNEPPLAVVNGKEMAEGEVITMHIDGQQVFVQLASVQDGQVVFRCRDQNIVVPLRRIGDPPRTAAR